jgi:hypothetical protein
MRVRSSLLLLPSLLMVAACAENARQPEGPTVPGVSPLVSDGRNGGNSYFFFLPPDIDATSINQTFSPVWASLLEARVCPVSAPGAACSGAQFALPAVTLAGTAPSQNYQTSWNPPVSQAVGDYRVTVYVKLPSTTNPEQTVDTELGWADVKLVPSGSGSGPANTYQITVGSANQPIKFFIGRGLASGNGTDLEGLITNAGGVYTCVSSQCGFYFPPGWLDGKTITQVAFFVQRYPKVNGECVTDGLVNALTPSFLQYDGCFKAFTIPDMGAPSQPITFGMCSEITSTNPLYHALSPFKYDESGATGVPGIITELQNAAPLGPGGVPLYSVTQCPTLTSMAPGQGSLLGGGARQFASRVAGFFAPKNAWAVDLGLGGQLGISFDAFSQFFWGVPFRVDVASGNNQSAEVGATLANPISVIVTGTHVHVHPILPTTDQQGQVALPNIPVTFTVTAGGGGLGAGLVSTIVVNTNASGIASVPWTLGLTEGTNTVTATVPDDPGTLNRRKTVTFTATGTPFSNKSTQIRVQSPVIKDQPVSDVTIKLGDETPFNAKLYQSGQTSTTSCTWAPLGQTQYLNIYVPGSDPGAVKITGTTTTPTQPKKGQKVTITCGTQKLDITIFVVN